MKAIVKFLKAIDRISGESDRGAWVRGGMVCRTIGDSERLVLFTAFGEEKVALCESFKLDDVLTVDFSPESREFGWKWFTDLRLIRATLLVSDPAQKYEGGAQ